MLLQLPFWHYFLAFSYLATDSSSPIPFTAKSNEQNKLGKAQNLQ